MHLDNNDKQEPSLKIPSAFKILLCFITLASILYFVLIERDFMKGLFLLNIIANYRIMLAFLTDWQEEIMFKEVSVHNQAHGIISNRKLYNNSNNNNNNNNEENCDLYNTNNISNFRNVSDIDNKTYKYLDSVYEDKINYNYNNYDNNFAWWTDF